MRKFMVTMMAILAVLLSTVQVAAVEYKNTYKGQQMEQADVTVATPSAAFQSTSTLPSSGSSFSANPGLNEDGTATYEGASYSPAQVPNGSGPRKSGTPGSGTNQQPLGDAVLPLLLLALAYLSTRVFLRRKRA